MKSLMKQKLKKIKKVKNTKDQEMTRMEKFNFDGFSDEDKDKI